MTSSDRDDQLSATKKADIHEPDSEHHLEGEVSLVGQVLSERYRIERHLGHGAMGSVYLAEHTLMHKRVAIKVLHAEMSRSPEVVARFEREAVAAGHIEHPNVASASDFGKLEDGSFFLVLEYIEGIGLRDALEQYGRLPPKRALHIAWQICSALVRAHELGIVHRDLKPENVMLVDRGGDPDFVKVLDFGIARVPIGELSPVKKGTSALTRAGMVYGTPEYMAPEQALGQDVDARADLYALGIMLYEMLVGQRPFFAESKVVLLGMHVTAPVPPMSDLVPNVPVAPEVEAFVRRLLAKDAGERPADAYEAEATLLALKEACATGTPSVTPPPLSRASSVSSVAGIDAKAATLAFPAKTTHFETPFGRIAKAQAFLGVAVAVLLAMIAIPSLLLAFRNTDSSREQAGDAGFSGTSTLGPETTASGPPTVELPKVERHTAEAIQLFEAGEMEAGRQALAKSKTPFESPDVQRAVAIGYFGKHRPSEALKALSLLAKSRQEQALAEPFKSQIQAAAASASASDAAYAFLEENPSPAAADILYELTFPPNTRDSITRAEKILRTQPMRGKASRSLDVALSLKDAGQDCEAVKYFDDAAKFGDGRALAFLELLEPLKSITYRKIPGHYKPVPIDAYACLRKDGSLARAIGAIKHRLAAHQSTK